MKKLVSLLLVLMLTGAFAAIPASAEPYVKLTWVQGCGSTAPTDAARVGEALNEITREKLGCEVDIIYMTGEQVALSIQAGEVYDMYFTCDWYNDYATNSYNGIFADITDLLPVVTPDLYAIMPPEVWEGAEVEGKVYGIPVKKDYCPEIYALFDKDFYDSIDMELPDEMSFLDLEPYLVAYKEAFPDRYPLMYTKAPSGSIDGTFNFLNRNALIGFPYSAVGTENATKVISVFEDPEVVAKVTKVHEWYEQGFVAPDSATTSDSGMDYSINFIKFMQGYYGADAGWSASYKYPIHIARLSGPYLSAAGVRGALNAFSATLESDPERLELCLKFQELVNTDKKYRDTLRYGIEGVHFNYNDDGTVTRTDEGKTNYGPWSFSQGAYDISAVVRSDFEAVPTDPDMWNVIFDGYQDAIVAADFGFTFNPSEYEMEIAQLTVIKDKWQALIYTGTVDPAEAIPEVLKEMEAAGLRKVIEGAQAQLDAYLAAKE